MKIDADIVGVSGDWHGAGWWAYHQLYKYNRQGIKHVFQVGDFGLWDSYAGSKYLEDVEAACIEFDTIIYVTLGNHENYDLYDFLIEDGSFVDDDGILWVRPRIAILPRPFLFEVNGRKIASLGGAPSIDKDFRTSHVDWWPQEIFTEEMLEMALSYGKVDIILAHDAPSLGAKEVENIIQYNPQGWGPEPLAYSKIGRDKMDSALDGLRPELWFHGHYHVSGQGFGKNRTLVTALNMNGEKNANVILNLDTMEPVWMN